MRSKCNFNILGHKIMKKIIFSFALLSFMFLGVSFAFAQEQPATTATPTTPVITEKPMPKPFDPVCIQNAIETRDTAIIAAFDKFSSAIKSALGIRKDALKAAWAKPIAKERRAAVKAAWDAYKKSTREAAALAKKERKAAWDQFRKDRIACKDKEVNATSGGEHIGFDGF